MRLVFVDSVTARELQWVLCRQHRVGIVAVGDTVSCVDHCVLRGHGQVVRTLSGLRYSWITAAVRQHELPQ